MDPKMHVAFVICYFSIWMSGCIVKEVNNAVVHVVLLSCGKNWVIYPTAFSMV